MTSSGGTQARRYHGLDGLRGFAMLLGIVLHATLPYFSRSYGFEHVWPADDDQSGLLAIVFDFIHTWRMPVFFLLAGFFAHLVLDRRATSTFVVDRLKRIALPLIALRRGDGGDRPTDMGIRLVGRVVARSVPRRVVGPA